MSDLNGMYDDLSHRPSRFAQIYFTFFGLIYLFYGFFCAESDNLQNLIFSFSLRYVVIFIACGLFLILIPLLTAYFGRWNRIWVAIGGLMFVIVAFISMKTFLEILQFNNQDYGIFQWYNSKILWLELTGGLFFSSLFGIFVTLNCFHSSTPPTP